MYAIRSYYEHPPRLLAEGEDREEGDGDDQQGVEERRPHLLGGSGNNLPVWLHAAIALEVFVGVLDHDDRRVNHRANGDGDAAKAHDVGVDPLGVHHQESNQDRNRQGKDRHQRAGRITSYNVCYTKLLRSDRPIRNILLPIRL